VVIDAPLPGIANWDEVKQSPLLRHFNFRGPDEERLVPDAMPIPAVKVSQNFPTHRVRQFRKMPSHRHIL
jgi:hypothetical protein